MDQFITINGRRIGPGYPAYVIAEISANHNGSFANACELVAAAKDAGADAVKLQTYTADTLTIPCDKDCFRIDGGTLWDGRTLHELYREASMPWEWQPELMRVARSVGLDLLSTAFDPTSVEFLEGVGVPAHKIASFEIVDLPLIRAAASKGKPLIVSTGMATFPEIDEAVRTARSAGADEVALLKCTSAYPAAAAEMNLRTIPHIAQSFGVPVGLSDHSMEIAVPAVAVALGACIVEKHFTLSRRCVGPDSAFSLEPDELRQTIAAIRTAEQALGVPRYGPTGREAKSLLFRKSLFVVKDVEAGEELTTENVRCIRPSHGLHPRYLTEVVGRRAARRVERGTPLACDAIAKQEENEERADGNEGAEMLRGARVTLRPMRQGDTDYVVRWRSEQLVAAQMFSPAPPSRQEHEAWFNNIEKAGTRREWIILAHPGEVPIGTIGLSDLSSGGKSAEYGVLIGDPAFRGRGYASEASALILDYAFARLVVDEVHLRVFSDNAAAVQLYAALGFQEDASMVEERVKDGKVRKARYMRLLRSDWERRGGASCLSSAL